MTGCGERDTDDMWALPTISGKVYFPLLTSLKLAVVAGDGLPTGGRNAINVCLSSAGDVAFCASGRHVGKER